MLADNDLALCIEQIDVERQRQGGPVRNHCSGPADKRIGWVAVRMKAKKCGDKSTATSSSPSSVINLLHGLR